jgi:hypothetical protein
MKKVLLSLAALAGMALLNQTPASAACATCLSSQECSPGGDGAYCVIFYSGGQQWCNWRDRCDVQISSLNLTPAGTLLASAERTVVEEGRAVLPCNGYVVARAEAAASGTDAASPVTLTL